MDKKKAESEISALITGISIIGLAFPVITVWILENFSRVASYLLSVGILERSERIVWQLSDGIGIDHGRLFMLSGFIILTCTLLAKCVERKIKK